jgi:predicted DsbA family dithiol-disulfide isomerase
MSVDAGAAMRVDIWSDVVCPWCYVGKARFEKALAAHPRRDETEVVYHERPVGNTFDIHRVVHLGLAQGRQPALVSAVNEAYFARAEQVFDPKVITSIAAGAGLDPAAVDQVLGSDAYADEVRQDEAQARQLGISGVPFFVFDMRLGVPGAQPTELFTQALDQAWEGARP